MSVSCQLFVVKSDRSYFQTNAATLYLLQNFLGEILRPHAKFRIVLIPVENDWISHMKNITLNVTATSLTMDLALHILRNDFEYSNKSYKRLQKITSVTHFSRCK